MCGVLVFYVIAQSLGESPDFCSWDAFTTFPLGISIAISSPWPGNTQHNPSIPTGNHRKNGHLHLRPQEFVCSCHVFKIMEFQGLLTHWNVSVQSLLTKMTCIFLMDWGANSHQGFWHVQYIRIKLKGSIWCGCTHARPRESARWISLEIDQSLKSMLLQEISILPRQALVTSAKTLFKRRKRGSFKKVIFKKQKTQVKIHVIF